MLRRIQKKKIEKGPYKFDDVQIIQIFYFLLNSAGINISHTHTR
jgi:hypothetical protein